VVVASLALFQATVRAQTPTPAPAGQSEETTQAKLLYDRGMAHFHLEEYDAAIEKWEAGFRTKPAPEFLYNIAQAYRLSHRPDRALSFYQKYLRMNPKALNRGEVERHIAALQKIVDQQARSQPPAESPSPERTGQAPAREPTNSPGAATAAPPGGPAAPAPVPSTTSPSPGVAPNAATLTGAAPPPKKPIYKKGWFWGVMAGAALVVAGGITAGVLASRSNEHALPDARF
jgi:tetratricopeptide (TPR) repeat protein